MIHVDYVWVDGLESSLIRSKTKIINPKVASDGEYEIPVAEWNFDGSSTMQATTSDSERIIQPQRVYKLSDRHYVALCEVCYPDTDRTPHESNYRAKLRESLSSGGELKEMWLGFEQEFFLTKKGKNVLWPKEGVPPNDTRYYCSSGAPIKFRKLIREFASLCNVAGIEVVGYNTEVAPGQWESGCHTNFSTKSMREEGGKELFEEIMHKAECLHFNHMKKYGVLNERRMTGIHETSSYDDFSYDVASRACSIRIPSNTSLEWKGYAEDRRPASNCDPYRVAACVLEFVS